MVQMNNNHMVGRAASVVLFHTPWLLVNISNLYVPLIQNV